ncbi:MAG TPA: 4Fe-4S dicluster domain-containing protein [Desulfosporosinus sp.]
MLQSGFQVEYCRPNCPKAARSWHNLYDKLITTLASLDLLESLEKEFQPILHHHLPKVCIAGCPNGCSQPNIKDFGISGYVTPQVTTASCSGCNACVRACLEDAITWQIHGITIDYARCLSCGDCQRVCPSGTLIAGESGWQLRTGGRVGRHPKFASTGSSVQTDEEVLTWISQTMSQYIKNKQPRERLTHYLERQKTLSD